MRRLSVLPLVPLLLVVPLLLTAPAALAGGDPDAPFPPGNATSPGSTGPCPVFRVDGPRHVAPGTTAAYRAVVTGGSIPEQWRVTRTAPGPAEVVARGTTETDFGFSLLVAGPSSFRVQATAYSGCAAPGHGEAVLDVTTGPPPTVAVTCPDTPGPARQRVAPNQPVQVVVTGAGATSTSRLYRRERDGSDTVVRQAPGNPTWTVAVPQTTLLGVGGQHSGGGEGCALRPLLLEVVPRLTLAATRTGPRTLAFTGRVLPGRGQAVTLLRHDGDRRVVTARGTVGPDGTYRIDRRFTGSGRHGFSVTVGGSSAHLAGSSAVRPTVVH